MMVTKRIVLAVAVVALVSFKSNDLHTNLYIYHTYMMDMGNVGFVYIYFMEMLFTLSIFRQKFVICNLYVSFPLPSKNKNKAKQNIFPFFIKSVARVYGML